MKRITTDQVGPWWLLSVMVLILGAIAWIEPAQFTVLAISIALGGVPIGTPWVIVYIWNKFFASEDQE